MQHQMAWRQWLDWRPVITGLAGAAGAALLIGIPTDVISNGHFIRMTPVRPQDYMFLAMTAALAGLVAASYAIPTPTGGGATGRLTTGGLLSFLAIGCPVCNKLVLLLLGTSGALSYWSPLQPMIGTASVLLLAATLWTRVQRLRSSCAVCT